MPHATPCVEPRREERARLTRTSTQRQFSTSLTVLSAADPCVASGAGACIPMQWTRVSELRPLTRRFLSSGFGVSERGSATGTRSTTSCRRLLVVAVGRLAMLGGGASGHAEAAVSAHAGRRTDATRGSRTRARRRSRSAAAPARASRRSTSGPSGYGRRGCARGERTSTIRPPLESTPTPRPRCSRR